ncbi:hypothetical protein GFI46_17535 [Salmonella enterica subsp. enterica]|nr:hypothetical protein [Salmonella enterica subsp. enterica serovar Kottbus]EDJ9186594.1 hypothetical protein [Salmonella enterica subsp. enterica serovar Kottbus]
MSDTELTIDQKIAVARIVTDLMISGIECRNGRGHDAHRTGWTIVSGHFRGGIPSAGRVAQSSRPTMIFSTPVNF